MAVGLNTLFMVRVTYSSVSSFPVAVFSMSINTVSPSWRFTSLFSSSSFLHHGTTAIMSKSLLSLFRAVLVSSTVFLFLTTFLSVVPSMSKYTPSSHMHVDFPSGPPTRRTPLRATFLALLPTSPSISRSPFSCLGRLQISSLRIQPDRQSTAIRSALRLSSRIIFPRCRFGSS